MGRNQLAVATLAIALSKTARLHVVRTYERIDQATTGLGDVDQVPDIMVVEHDGDAETRTGGVRGFRSVWPRVPVIVTAVPPDLPTVVASIEAGARGLLTMDSGLDDLVSAIGTVSRGQMACSAAITTLMLEAIATDAPPGAHAVHPSLTPREGQVIRLLERGMSNKEIARQLDIKVATVKNHVHSILTKLDLSHRGLVRARLGGRRDLSSRP